MSINPRSSINIRKAYESDWPEIWSILEPISRTGEIFTWHKESTEEDLHSYWLTSSTATFVAKRTNGPIIGTYYIKENLSGQGSHVCNCSYAIDKPNRNYWLLPILYDDSQAKARQMGFLAMQFNLVSSANVGELRLLIRHGFQIVGRLPGAFNSSHLGFIDAYILYKLLDQHALANFRNPGSPKAAPTLTLVRS